MPTPRTPAPFLGALLVLLAGTVRTEGCRISTGLPGFGTGAIEVATSTVGAGIDPDGYTAVVTDARGRTTAASIGTDDRVRFTDLEGDLNHRIELAGVAPNCAVVGLDAVTLFLTRSETAVVAFEVECRTLHAFGESGR